MRLVLLVTQSDYFLSHRQALAAGAIREGYDVHLVTQVVGDRGRLDATRALEYISLSQAKIDAATRDKN